MVSRAERIVDDRTNGPTGGRNVTSRMIFNREQYLSYPFATIAKRPDNNNNNNNNNNNELLLVKNLFFILAPPPLKNIIFVENFIAKYH